MRKFSFFKDIDNQDSIKRLGLVIMLLDFQIILICDLFFKKTLHSTILETIGWITASFITSVAAEKFVKKYKKDEPEISNTTKTDDPGSGAQ